MMKKIVLKDLEFDNNNICYLLGFMRNSEGVFDYEIAKKEYDAYYNRNGDFVIILNRTKMIILDK